MPAEKWLLEGPPTRVPFHVLHDGRVMYAVRLITESTLTPGASYTRLKFYFYARPRAGAEIVRRILKRGALTQDQIIDTASALGRNELA